MLSFWSRYADTLSTVMLRDYFEAGSDLYHGSGSMPRCVSPAKLMGVNWNGDVPVMPPRRRSSGPASGQREFHHPRRHVERLRHQPVSRSAQASRPRHGAPLPWLPRHRVSGGKSTTRPSPGRRLPPRGFGSSVESPSPCPSVSDRTLRPSTATLSTAPFASALLASGKSFLDLWPDPKAR